MSIRPLGLVYVYVIITLNGLTYKNIEKMANKIFNLPNHLNQEANRSIVGVPKVFVNASKAKGEKFSSKFLDFSSAYIFNTKPNISGNPVT